MSFLFQYRCNGIITNHYFVKGGCSCKEKIISRSILSGSVDPYIPNFKLHLTFDVYTNDDETPVEMMFDSERDSNQYAVELAMDRTRYVLW